MYVNFGEIGVYLGMAALGMLLGWMESLYYRHARNLFIECALIQVSWTIGFYADRFAMVVMTLIPGVVLVWLVCQSLASLYYLPFLFNPVREPVSNRG
jgi:hypothetical protein